MAKIDRFKTAISRKSQSKPYRMILKASLINRDDKILDYGCGKGYDFMELKKQDFNIKGYDKFNHDFDDSNVLKDEYDIIICNYVFNVIEDKEERTELFNQLKELGRKLIISVRADTKAIKENWQVFDDGYITQNNTFQKFYSEKDVIENFGENVEFISNTSTEKIFMIN